MTLLKTIGIYSWAHLAQVLILLAMLTWCFGWAIPACWRDTKKLWEELEDEEK